MGWRTFVLILALLAPIAGASGSQAPSAIPPFLLTVSVAAPGDLHDAASLGVQAGATDGYDSGLDVPKPPPPPGGPWLAAYVVEPGDASERLSRSVEGVAPNASWSLRVDLSGPAGQVDLAWNRSQLDAFPEAFTLNATYQGATVDLRDSPTLSLQKGDGPFSAQIAIQVEPMWGSAPGAPENLTTRPTLALGGASLAWSAPSSDGGHAVRSYVVYRSDNGSWARPVARVSGTAWNDSGLALGGRYRYAVSAVNRVGEGDVSQPVSWLGTGKPLGLDAGPEQPGDRGLADVDAPVPGEDVGTPPVGVPILEVHGSPDVIDPRDYDVTFSVLGRPSHTVGVGTVVPLDVPIDVSLLSLPGESARTPGAHAHVSAQQRGLATLVVRTSADAGPLHWSDATALP